MIALQLVAEENGRDIGQSAQAGPHALTQASNDDAEGRNLEAGVLNKAADKLEDVLMNWDEDRGYIALDSALKYNQTIWSVFQADLLTRATPLPEALRENMLALATFVDKRTFEVMAYPSPEKLDILIKINRGLAESLLESLA